MYSIPPSEPGVTLHALRQPALYFSSRYELYRHLGWHVLYRFVGPRLDASIGHYFTIRDLNDRALLAVDFVDLVPRAALSRYRPGSWLSAYLRNQELREARPCGPIPGTGRRRGGNAYRSPRTRAERRTNIFVDHASGEPAFRSARSWKTLASSWDDLVRSDYRLRSWKQYRKHQWKE